jgi:hypothetical protein
MRASDMASEMSMFIAVVPVTRTAVRTAVSLVGPGRDPDREFGDLGYSRTVPPAVDERPTGHDVPGAADHRPVQPELATALINVPSTLKRTHSWSRVAHAHWRQRAF